MPVTRHFYAHDPEQVREAAGLLREGKLVAFATETVYGLGANAFSPGAVAEIFRAKDRPAWDPLIVHLASADRLAEVAAVPEAFAERVARLTAEFWPGPLTLLLPRISAVSDAVTAGRDRVGVRVPAHEAAQALLRAAGVPVAAPSANHFGHVSPTTAAHVLADLSGRIDAVLDAGPCSVGVESTVLDPLQTPMVVYRQGAVTVEALQKAAGVAVKIYMPAAMSSPDVKAREGLPSPGVGLRHYAPRARLVLVEGSPDAVLRQALEAADHNRIGLLWPGDWDQKRVKQHAKDTLVVYPWGRWADPHSRAATLFAGLRALDEAEVAQIVCPLPPPGGLDDAIRERLEKAAHKV